MQVLLVQTTNGRMSWLFGRIDPQKTPYDVAKQAFIKAVICGDNGK